MSEYVLIQVLAIIDALLFQYWKKKLKAERWTLKRQRGHWTGKPWPFLSSSA